MHPHTRPSPWSSHHASPQVRDLLLCKQERLAAALKALAVRVPRDALASAGARFADLERQLRAKAATIEEVEARRRLVEELPGKMAPLLAEVEATKVGGSAFGWLYGVHEGPLARLPYMQAGLCTPHRSHLPTNPTENRT
jgi:hypothetical protein